MKKKEKAELLKDVCLHCGFFQMHQDKWPKWSRENGEQHQEAFNDLVANAIKITAEVFSMLHTGDQIKFMRRVMEKAIEIESPEPGHAIQALKELFDTIKSGGPTKH